MGLFLIWMSAHWFSLLQAIGIVGGLAFTGMSLRLNARNQKTSALITITQKHQSLWLELFDSPELKRILEARPGLRKIPVTDDERLFVNLVFLHLTATLYAVRKRVMEKPAGFDVDIRSFVSLPIPKRVWNDTKKFRDPATIIYVEKLLEN